MKNFVIKWNRKYDSINEPIRFFVFLLIVWPFLIGFFMGAYWTLIPLFLLLGFRLAGKFWK